MPKVVIKKKSESFSMLILGIYLMYFAMLSVLLVSLGILDCFVAHLLPVSIRGVSFPCCS